MKKYLNLFAILAVLGIGAVLGGSALSLSAQTWSGPPGAPPTCPAGSPGCDAPINVGGLLQTRSGALNLTGLFTLNDIQVARSFRFATATAAIGKVLTALDSSGNVGWATPAAGASLQISSTVSVSSTNNGTNQAVIDTGGNWSACFLTKVQNDNNNSSHPLCYVQKGVAGDLNNWYIHTQAGSSDSVTCSAMCIK